MKPAIVLNHFAIICVFVVSIMRPIGSEQLTVDIEASKNIEDGRRSMAMKRVNEMKFNVMKTTKDLKNYSTFIYLCMRAKKKRFEKVSLKLIHERINEKLDLMWNLVRITEKNGVNVTECYTSTKTNMTRCIEDLKRSNCDAVDTVPIDRFIHKINETTEMGDKILYYLDKVIFNCCTTNHNRFHKCVINNVSGTKKNVTDYRQSLKTIREKGNKLKSNHSNFQCFGKRAGEILLTKLDYIYNNGTQCILKLKNGPTAH